MDTGPSFAAPAHIMSVMRGFDLDDDAQQIDECERLAAEDDLAATGWQYLGVLRYRAGQWDAAVTAFERAAKDDALRTSGRYLAACARVRAGDAAGALSALDALLEDGPEDEQISRDDVELARADALWSLARVEEAERAYLDVLEREPRGDAWLDVAVIRAGLGRRAEALSAIERCLEADDQLHGALYLRAALRAEAADAPGAIEALDAALALEPAYAARARDDARFARLRGDPGFEARTAPPPPKDLGWIDRIAALAALRADPALAALGVAWSTEQEAAEGGEAIQARYAESWHLGVLWNDAIWAACVEISRGKRLLASCTAGPSRNGLPVHGELYIDPARPEEILFALSSEVPPVLWIPVPAEAGALRDALSEFYPSRRVPRLELPRVRRAFMGELRELAVPNPYSGELEQAGPHALDRHWNFSPYVDAMSWGTAAPDDPWPDRIPPQPGYQLKMIAMSRKVRAQREGGVCGFTRRTLFSRAQITTELHQRAHYVWEIRYRPSRHTGVIERLNERFGFRYPTDLPLDVVGAILGFEYIEVDWLEARLAEQTEPGAIAAYLRVIASVRHSDLGVTRFLRRFMDHKDITVRATLANLCVEYGWEFLLEDLGAKEPHGELRSFIERVLDEGITPPQFDDMGEPVGLYGEDEDEGEDGERKGDEDDEDDDEDEDDEDEDGGDEDEDDDGGDEDEDDDEDDDEDEEA